MTSAVNDSVTRHDVLPGIRASPDHTGGAHDSDDHQQTEDAHDAANRDTALLEPRHDEFVDDHPDNNRREHCACSENGGASHGREEQGLVMSQEAADQAERLGRPTDISRNDRCLVWMVPFHTDWF